MKNKYILFGLVLLISIGLNIGLYLNNTSLKFYKEDILSNSFQLENSKEFGYTIYNGSLEIDYPIFIKYKEKNISHIYSRFDQMIGKDLVVKNISGGDFKFVSDLMGDIFFEKISYHFESYNDNYGEYLIGTTDVGYPFITEITIHIDKLAGIDLSNTLNFLSDIYLRSRELPSRGNILILEIGGINLSEENLHEIFNMELDKLELHSNTTGDLTDIERLSLIRDSDIQNIWLGEKYSKKDGIISYLDDRLSQIIEIE